MKKKLLIIGAGGFGREVAWLVERINEVRKEWNIIGFIDDNITMKGKVVNGYPVLGSCDEISTYPDAYCICAVGTAGVRRRIINKIISLNPNVRFATLVDPQVVVSPLVELGEGSIICAGTIMTVNITIGKHCIINLRCNVGHDVIIEDFVTIYPGVNISGNVNIGENVEIGTGTSIIHQIEVGRDSVIGAGAVVVNNLNEKGTYIGVPATMKRRF